MENNNEVKVQTGALLDHRTEEQKAMDWLHEELFAGALKPDWKEKNPSEIKRYTPRNQGMSLSCVANGGAIALEANELKESGVTRVFSHKDIYIRRANKPYGGMNMPDVLKLLREGGAFEGQVPSMGLSETPINQAYPVTNEILKTRSTYSAGASVTLQSYNIDTIAGLIDMGIPVILFWFFSAKSDYAEWWNTQPKVVEKALGLYDADALHHQASAVDYTLIDGKKYLIVQDSAGVGTGLGESKDIRYVSEDFFKARVYGAGYTIDKKNLDYVVDDKPRYNFTRPLKNGDNGEDVKALQKILVYEKCMVLNSPTIYFRGATLAGVKKLQVKYADKILKPSGLKLPTGYVGTNTLNWLKENYAL